MNGAPKGTTGHRHCMEIRLSFFAGLPAGLLACSTASTGCAGMSDDATSVDMANPAVPSPGT